MEKLHRIILIIMGLLTLFLLLVGSVFAAPSLFDWNDSANSWPDPSFLTRTFSGVGSPSTTFTYTFTGDTNRFLPGISPQTNTIITGGLEAHPTLFIGADFVTTSEDITLTIDLSSHAVDVSFMMMDIDAFNGGPGNILVDEIVVSGSNSLIGLVTPTLTATIPSNVNVSGNVATAINGLIDNNTDGGNVMVSFGAAINQISIVYRPELGSSTDPSPGGIALHDISFTPASPTAVSFQSLTVQSGGVTAVPFLAAGVFMLGITAVFLRHSRRRLKTVH